MMNQQVANPLNDWESCVKKTRHSASPLLPQSLTWIKQVWAAIRIVNAPAHEKVNRLYKAMSESVAATSKPMIGALSRLRLWALFSSHIPAVSVQMRNSAQSKCICARCRGSQYLLRRKSTTLLALRVLIRKVRKNAQIKTVYLRKLYPLHCNGFRRFTRHTYEIFPNDPKGIRGARHLRFAPVAGKAGAPEPADAASPRCAGPLRTSGSPCPCLIRALRGSSDK
jgi:hypothetical protein